MKAGHYCWLNEEAILSTDASATLIVLQLK
jgi:hypothetical protein